MAIDLAKFTADVLTGIGAPLTPANVTFLQKWENIEGGAVHNTAYNNPLNTSLIVPGSVNFTSQKSGSGVQAYPTQAAGEAATIATITEAPYVGVVNALKASNQQAAAQALVASPWDAGHYGGNTSEFLGGSSSSAVSSSTATTPTPTVDTLSAPVKSAPAILKSIDHALNSSSGGIANTITGGLAGGFGLNPVTDLQIGVARAAVAGAGFLLIATGLALLVLAIGPRATKAASIIPSPVQPYAAAANKGIETVKAL